MSTIVLRCVVRAGLPGGCAQWSEPTGAAESSANPYTVRGTRRRSAHTDARVPVGVRDARGENPVVTQEQRKRQLAREKFLRQQQRRTAARRKARIRNSVIASVLGVVVVGSVALYTTGVLKDDDKANASAETSPSAAATSKAPDPCEKPAAGKVKTADLEEGAGAHHRQVGEVHDGARDDLRRDRHRPEGVGGAAHGELVQLPRRQGLSSTTPSATGSPPTASTSCSAATRRAPAAAVPATRSRTRT